MTKKSSCAILLAVLSGRSGAFSPPPSSPFSTRDRHACRRIRSTPVGRISPSDGVRLRSTAEKGVDRDTTLADEARRAALAKKRSSEPTSS
eukprot:CAMPEP_0172562298 /NCGR_PEP_ID=MMETSP1067-20121228/96396_1 /TAXON_ID=265564 ORGANISM="Thalassiosira punctigera, Strain Tpunct2005C2" /NCGR_SAMPLE_ID=MMETSP1067 /ASSEMBLY_ACC=CAM_ASM_000444 /LENGTH=90 /DNA_ID=CAMNT_0013352499 /DNA_START=29 /DNA_END=297 /DNA_ORIENTATION=+